MNKDNNILLKLSDLRISIFSGNIESLILENVSFYIRNGESIALLGASGSGKTICSLSLLGLLPEYLDKKVSGKAIFNNDGIETDLLNSSNKELSSLRGNKIAFIFQDPLNALNPIQTCGKQIREPIRNNLKLKEKEIKAKVIELIEKTGLEEASRIYNSYPHELSGGQLQRVLIAMALGGQPDLLIADEPTTNLDREAKEAILDLLEKLKKEYKLSLLYITHDHSTARRMADRFYILDQGRINEIQASDLETDTSFDLLGLKKESKKLDEKAREVLIDVRAVSKAFFAKSSIFGSSKHRIEVLEDIDLQIIKQGITGLVGASGSGKTTLGRIILQLEQSDRGEVLYKNIALGNIDAKELRSYRKELQIVYQNPFNTLNPRMRVRDIVKEPLIIHKIGKGKKERYEMAADMLNSVGIDTSKHGFYMFQLSGGQRQRVAIARALILKPQFIVLDECISSLDQDTQFNILELLMKLKDDHALSYLFISHDTKVVNAISDRIYYLKEHKLYEAKS